MDLTVLTLNLWFDLKLQEARTRALLEVIRSLSPSLCCFQEVVPQVARQLREALPGWQCSDSTPDNATVQPYGVMAFVQPGISAEFELHPLPTAMSRSLLLVRVPGLTVGTVHLESLANPRMREEQLRQCASILAPCSNVMLVGDFNFDSERNFKAPHEPLENAALGLLQDFIDLWPTLRPGEPGKTFDSRLNPYIGEYEQMRYDRVMVKLEAWTATQIRLVGDEPLNHLVKLTPMEEDWLQRPPTPKRPQPGCRKSIDFELDVTPTAEETSSSSGRLFLSDHFGLLTTLQSKAGSKTLRSSGLRPCDLSGAAMISSLQTCVPEQQRPA